MPAHMQQQILDALVALLASGSTAAGTSVYVDRLDPLPKGKAAAIVVAESEQGETVAQGTIKDVQQRDMEIEIACVLKACDNAVAKARDLALEVEKIVSPRVGSPMLQLANDWKLTASRPLQSGEGEEAIAARVLTYVFTYLVRKGSPDVAA